MSEGLTVVDICQERPLIPSTHRLRVGDSRNMAFLYDNSVHLIEFAEDSFRSPKDLLKAVKGVFFNLKLGIPVVLSTHINYLIDVVNKFNPDPKFMDS